MDVIGFAIIGTEAVLETFFTQAAMFVCSEMNEPSWGLVLRKMLLRFFDFP
jgi:hypothetical protein